MDIEAKLTQEKKFEKKEQTRRLEEILLKNKHVIDIEYDPEWHIPNIDYSKFKAEERGYAPRPIGTLKEYLRNPYIKDDFNGNHDARREWISELEHQYPWFNEFYRCNMLKYGNQSQILIDVVGLLKEMYEGSNPDKYEELIDKAHDLCMMSVLGFNKKSLQERINYIKKIKHAVFDILDFLSYKK